MLKYSFGGSHALRSDRMLAFWSALQGARVLEHDDLVLGEPVLAEEAEILLFHTKEYIEFVKRASRSGIGYLDYGDTPAFKGVYEAASYVVGSTLQGLRAVMSGEAEHAFNPMGGLHHARRDRAGGFCVFNDPSIAIAAGEREYGLERILYMDIDAHHGDGVLYGFYEDPRVFIADVHEDGRFCYPGTGFRWETGAGEAKGTKLNIPLKPGAGDLELEGAIGEIEEFADRAEPELIVLQCGADGLCGDPLTYLCYSLEGHRNAVKLAHDLARRHCDGKLLALGGGGYNRASTAKAWLGVVEELLT